MKSLLPNRQTIRPSRQGLVYHEIIADGLIHSASVVGIESDERLVERVVALAWCNGAKLVRESVPAAAVIASRLRESLEASSDEVLSICRQANEHASASSDVLVGLRSHCEGAMLARELELTSPEGARRARQLIGLAALGGIHSRGLAPSLYERLEIAVGAVKGEQRFLSQRLYSWALRNGVPWDHPFLELLSCFYHDTPTEHGLIASAVADKLSVALRRDQPWSLDYWIEEGWRSGDMFARFAPDSIDTALDEYTDEILNFCAKLEVSFKSFREKSTDLREVRRCGFAAYVEQWDPSGLADPEFRESNPLITVCRAYDYAFWMSVCFVRPGIFHAKGGVS